MAAECLAAEGFAQPLPPPQRYGPRHETKLRGHGSVCLLAHSLEIASPSRWQPSTPSQEAMLSALRPQAPRPVSSARSQCCS